MPADAFDLGAGLDLVRQLIDERRQGPVTRWQPPEELLAGLDLDIGAQGCDVRRLLDAVRECVRHSVNTAHRHFYNQLFSGFNPTAFLGEVVATLLNTTMATYEASPVTTLIETAVIARLGRLVGYAAGDGIFTGGGSESNMVAMLCAREHRFPSIRSEGMHADRPLVALISDQAHYSFGHAANVLGIGHRRLVQVQSDSRGRMRPEALESTVRACLDEGLRPFFVGATAGTSVLGAFDPIDEIAEVAAQHGLWFHVDGCLGAPALLTFKYRRLLAGCERSDSMAWDAHKLMGVPLSCSALLTRQPGVLEAACAPIGADYLFHGDEPDSRRDLGRKSLHCGRRADAVKLWVAWKYFGDAGYETRITRLFDLACVVADLVEASPALRLAAPVSSICVCFGAVAPPGVDADALNHEIRRRMHRSGAAFVNYARVGGSLVLRLAVSNADLTAADLQDLVRRVEKAREDVLAGASQIDFGAPSC